MAADCQTCPQLRARLMALTAEVQSARSVIDRELEEPTLPRARLLLQTEMRLRTAVDNARGC